jgi:hypothetical protein
MVERLPRRSVGAPGIVGAIVLMLVLGGCRGVADEDLSRLVADIEGAFPNEIAAIDFENAPPLDPPTIFIDLWQDMNSTDQRRFLCDQVKPLVDAVDPNINVVVSWGWAASDDCP